MQQPAPQTMNTPPSTPLNLVTTEQIQMYLDENKNLIMAILECQKMGKVAECAQYQAILQKNLMYLAAIADAQPQGSSSKPSQPHTGPITPRGDSHMLQMQASAVQQQPPPQQPGGHVPKLPFQLNAVRPLDQQNQLLHFQQQQQLQGQFSHGGGAHNGLNLLIHPGASNSSSLMDLRGNQQGALDASSGGGQGNSALGRIDGRE